MSGLTWEDSHGPWFPDTVVVLAWSSSTYKPRPLLTLRESVWVWTVCGCCSREGRRRGGGSKSPTRTGRRRLMRPVAKRVMFHILEDAVSRVPCVGSGRDLGAGRAHMLPAALVSVSWPSLDVCLPPFRTLIGLGAVQAWLDSTTVRPHRPSDISALQRACIQCHGREQLVPVFSSNPDLDHRGTDILATGRPPPACTPPTPIRIEDKMRERAGSRGMAPKRVWGSVPLGNRMSFYTLHRHLHQPPKPVSNITMCISKP